MEISKPLKIFIADDDADDREFLKFLFEKNDSFEIVGCFESGAQVISEIGQGNVPDILLIDMYMPRMTGTEVLTELLQDPATANMFIFIISTTINETQQQKFIENPRIKFLAKPTTLTQLNDLPGELLESLEIGNNTKI